MKDFNEFFYFDWNLTKRSRQHDRSNFTPSSRLRSEKKKNILEHNYNSYQKKELRSEAGSKAGGGLEGFKRLDTDTVTILYAPVVASRVENKSGRRGWDVCSDR